MLEMPPPVLAELPETVLLVRLPIALSNSLTKINFSTLSFYRFLGYNVIIDFNLIVYFDFLTPLNPPLNLFYLFAEFNNNHSVYTL